MTPIWLRTRSELRARWRAALGLAIVIGLSGGVVMAAAAGARRTESAYPRLLVAQNGTQGLLVSDPGAFFGFASLDFDKIRAMPEVVDTASIAIFVGFWRTPSGKLLTPIGDRNPVVSFASPDGRFDHALNRMRAREGRLPDQSRSDEAAVSYEAATRYGIRVGDVLVAMLPTQADLRSTSEDLKTTGPTLPIRVTAITIAPGELAGGVGYPPIHLTPAFYAAYAKLSPQFRALAFKLKDDSLIAPFLSRVQSTAVIGGPKASHRPEFLSLLDNARAIERTSHVQAVALWLLALLTGVATLLILVQSIARQTLLESSDYQTLSALGLARGQLFGIAMIRTALVAIVGTFIAALMAFGLSPLMPIGISRIAELHPGLQFDGLVLGLGAAGMAVLVMLAGLYPAMRVSRAGMITRFQQGQRRPSVVADLFARTGFSPPSVAGVRMALESGRGHNTVPVRSTIIGAVIAITAVATALTFGASLDHVRTSPRLQGWNWDASLGDDFDPENAARVLPVLRGNPFVEAISAGGAATVSAGGHDIGVVGMDQIAGRITPVLLDGHEPFRDDEIVLGARTMRETGAKIGDSISLSAGARHKELRVVGRAVAPSIANEAFSGRGGFMTFAALRELLPSNAEDIYLFTARPGKLKEAITGIRSRLPGLALQTGPSSGDVSELTRVRGLPLVLAGVLALLGAATMAHLLVTAIRRRRTDLAILKTLGFVRGQVRSTVAWQASALAICALAVGLPLGVVAGRWSWSLLASQIGFPSEPDVRLGTLLLTIPGALLIVNAIAAFPARAAARMQPADVLRVE